ncbi:hypothetical protein F0562_027958 [Nyssa sinensis]|uniref:Uncharacterized protein n=1 Tax=Nyssa sinensis TaxID=561372 RepID=A0A5J5B670_9ASTE|nr:hypothetical protein F0562_027958 [Nyssa sinensis]
MLAIFGKILEHNDKDSDRKKGKKLDVGFCENTNQWEETFGSRYWRAGAMYKGSTPSPFTINLCRINTASKKVVPSIEYQDMIQLPKKMLVQVFLEIVGVKNLPAGHTGSLVPSFSKKQPDWLFNMRRSLSIFCEPGNKEVAAFQCAPAGEILFELMSYSPPNLSSSPKILGTTLISLADLLNPVSKLSVENWFELVPASGIVGPKVWHAKSWTSVVDETGNQVISIQMRIQKFQRGEMLVFPRKKHKKVAILHGRKLGYEIKNCERQKNEQDFMTMVEFSAENPYGKVVALLKLKSGFLKVEEQWFLLPGITLAFILTDILMKEGFNCSTTKEENSRETNEECGGYSFSGWTEAGACGGSGGCGASCDGGGCSSDHGSHNHQHASSVTLIHLCQC